MEVLNRSATVCKQSYQKPIITVETAEHVIQKKSLGFNLHQQNVFILLYYYRDQLAREYDESSQFILPQASLIKLTRSLPRNTTDIPRLIHPVPSILRSHLHDIIELVKKGCELNSNLNDNKMISIVMNVLNGEMEEEEEEEKKENSNSMEEVQESNVMKKAEDLSYHGVLDKMVEEGAKLLKKEQFEGHIQVNEHMSHPQRKLHLETIASIVNTKEKEKKKVEVEENLNLYSLLHDVAMMNAVMECDEDEEKEEEEKQVKKQKEEEEDETILSLRQTYHKAPTSESNETVSLKRKGDSIDDLLGVKEVDMTSTEKMKKDIGWKTKKPRVEKEKLPTLKEDDVKNFIQSIGAKDYMMTEEETKKTTEMLHQGEKKERNKKGGKKRFRKGRNPEQK